LVAVAGLAWLLGACGSGYTAVEKPAAAGWKSVGAWSGHGTRQTESFTTDTGDFRVHWETRNETQPGTGRLRVVVHSLDSGRELYDAVNVRGVGRGAEDVGSDRPRWYFLTIESANVDWNVTVEESIEGAPK
jgi:hypothetical protein